MILVISLITSCFVCFLLTCVPTGVSLLSSSPVWCHLHTCLTSSWWSLPVSPPAPPPPTLSFSYCVFLLALCRFFCFAPVFPARLTCPPVHLSTCPPVLRSWAPRITSVCSLTPDDFCLVASVSAACCLCLHDWINWTNKLTLKNDTNSVSLCLYVADPATSPASHSVPGPSFPLRTAVCIITSLISWKQNSEFEFLH